MRPPSGPGRACSPVAERPEPFRRCPVIAYSRRVSSAPDRRPDPFAFSGFVGHRSVCAWSSPVPSVPAVPGVRRDRAPGYVLESVRPRLPRTLRGRAAAAGRCRELAVQIRRLQSGRIAVYSVGVAAWRPAGRCTASGGSRCCRRPGSGWRGSGVLCGRALPSWELHSWDAGGNGASSALPCVIDLTGWRLGAAGRRAVFCERLCARSSPRRCRVSGWPSPVTAATRECVFFDRCHCCCSLTGVQPAGRGPA